MYDAFLITNIMSDGTLAYPRDSEKGDINLNGMSFEVRYIDSLYHHCPMHCYNLLGTFRSLIQEAKTRRLLLTTFR